MNPMRDIVISKLVINIGTGSDDNVQQNAKRLLNLLTGKRAADEISRKRNPAFKITKGQKIGAFVTLRGNAAREVLKRLLEVHDNMLAARSVTDNSISFGIKEYIDISGLKYDPKIGMLGMNVNLSFKRRGLRVALRKRQRAEVPSRHRRIGSGEIMEYMAREFKTQAQAEQVEA
jgi:large subunit ribosomal protein L5